jgi:hypothetical protein
MAVDDARLAQQAERLRIQGLKLLHDTVKHLTTLSSGAILILGGFVEKLFQSPSWKPLILVSLGGFSIVIVVSAFWFIVNVALIPGLPGQHSDPATDSWARDLHQRAQGMASWYLQVMVFAFATGMISFAAFAIRNFWTGNAAW